MGLRHIEAYQRAGATVVAASDIQQEKKAALNMACPTATFYERWQDLLEKEPLDMLSVVTNGPSHAEIVIAAAAARVPTIMCEKPMATSVADAKRMQQACDAAGSKLYVNFTLRAFVEFQKLIALARQGTLGDIRIVSVYIGGARGLGCVGSHYVDLMRLLLGEPVRVHGRIDKTGTPNPRGEQFSDPGGWGVYEFANSARGFLEMSEDYTLPPYVVVVGSKGRVTIDVAQNRWDAQVFENKEWHTLPLDVGAATTVVEGTQAMLEDAAAGGTMAAQGQDGVAALGMILGIHAADTHEGPVTLPLPDEFENLTVPMT
jgi:predicted dehydrogenase